MPKVSVITVGMNHLSYLKALLPSLFGENKPKVPFEMIYVDNCSHDGSVDFIRENYPLVKIIINKEPLGFGENNNKGVLASTGKYIAIINPDIVLQSGSIDALYDYAEKNPDAGMVVPQLLNPDGSIQYSVRGFISVGALMARVRTGGRDDATDKKVEEYLCRNIDFSKTQPIDWAIGAAMFLSRDTYAELGGFDMDYFLYMEDEDICLRVWKMNRPVIYLPESRMIHNHLRASSKIGKKMLMHINSMKKFFIKHGFNIDSYKEKEIGDNKTM